MKTLRIPCKPEQTIIPIDHGFGNLKTSKFSCIASVKEVRGQPMFAENYLEYNGKRYVVGEQYERKDMDKTSTRDYYLLTLVGIAEELLEYADSVYGKKDTYEAKNIILAVGLPVEWLDSQAENFHDYLLRERNLMFSYKEKKFNVHLADCIIMAQGYGCVAPSISDFDKQHMVMDIGSKTINILKVEGGNALETSARTNQEGVYTCFLKARDMVQSKLKIDLPYSVFEAYVRKGKAGISANDDVCDILYKACREYANSIFDLASEAGWNDSLMKLHLFGGGSLIVQKFGDYDRNRVLFNTDIHAQAKGYEYLAYCMLLEEA